MLGQINHADHAIQDETIGGNTHTEELKEGFKKRKGNSYICIYWNNMPIILCAGHSAKIQKEKS